MVKLSRGTGGIDVPKTNNSRASGRGFGASNLGDGKNRSRGTGFFGRGGRANQIKNSQVNRRYGWGTPLPIPRRAATGLVPYGFGFYGTPNRPIDPRDCSLWVNSPYCGGTGFDLFGNFGGSIDVIGDECNSGIRLSPTFARVRFPPYELVYRKKECRHDPGRGPEDRPDWTNKKPKDFKNGVFSSSKGSDLYYTELIGISNRYVEHILESEEVYFQHNLSERHNFTEGGGFEVALEEVLDDQGYRTLHDAGAELLPTDPLWVANQVKKWEIFTENAPKPDPQPGVIWHEFTDKTVYLRLLEFRETWLSPNLSTGEPKLSPYGGRPYHDVLYHFRKIHYEFESMLGYTPAKTHFFDLQEVENGTNLVKSKDPLKPPPPPNNKKCKCMKCCKNSGREFRRQRQKNDRILNELTKIKEMIGWEDSNVPVSLITRDGVLPEQKTLKSLFDWLVWYTQRFEEIIGEFEIPIEIEDLDPSQPGNQTSRIRIPNVAEALAEIVGLAIQTHINAETIANITTRTLLEAGQAKQTAIQNEFAIQTLIDFLGYRTQEQTEKIAFTFDPAAAERFDTLLQHKELDVIVKDYAGVGESERKNSMDMMLELLQAAAIIRSVFFHPASSQADIKAYLQDLKAKTDTILNQDDDFKAWMSDAENAFGTYPQGTQLSQPWGTDPSTRPNMTEITPKRGELEN